MKTTTISCPICEAQVEKPTKEVKRRIGLGKKLYCSRSCSGKDNVKHFKAYFEKNHSPEHIRMISDRAAIANTKYTKADAPFQEHLRRASKRGKACDLTLEYLKEVWGKQKGCCAISGIPMEQLGAVTNSLLMASLDRKDSSVGYLVGNVQFVVCAINLGKKSESDSSMHAFLRLVTEHYVVDKPDAGV